MKPAPVRSTLFNLSFYLVTGLCCLLFLPGFLLPRKTYLFLVRLWLRIVMFLERVIMGIRYEVRGRENLPEGACIVAAKHQSPYETLKIHLLFDDPAIVLKQELLKIPFWGAYLKKSGVIAIDRSAGGKALKSAESSASQAAKAGRPIIIFPQGTRVRTDETPAEKPYKPGVYRIQQATNLPVVPLALNTGLFWPRSGWLKSPGTVVFEFLKPIPPGKNRQTLMRSLEKKLETHTDALMNESRIRQLDEEAKSARAIYIFLIVFALLFGGYTWLWHETAEQVKTSYVAFTQDLAGTQRILSEPVVTGYPGPITLRIQEDRLLAPEGSVKLENILLQGWPVPATPIRIQAGPITVKSFKWPAPVHLDSLDAVVTYFDDMLTIRESDLYKQDFHLSAFGRVNLKQEPIPVFNVVIRMQNHDVLLGYLAAQKIIDKKAAIFMTAGFGALAKDGIVEVPITQRDNKLYAGPLRIAEIPVPSEPTANPSFPAPETESLPAPTP